MAAIDKTNVSMRLLKLPKEVNRLLAVELGWIRPLDVLVYLAHVYPSWPESRPNRVRAVENKLIRTPGFGKARTKKVVDALIAHDII